MSQVGAGALVGQRLGKYELLALLAVGGTAEIYLARIGGEAGFEKYVVVKCLLDHLADEPEFVKMFLDEARLGAQLDHSNIVQTLELGEQDGRYYMAMEYLAGMSLAHLARKTQERVPGGYIPVKLVLGLAAQACAGLHYAHRKPTADGKPLNLVHRDISPQNLVVSFDGVLKIVDFGIAKADVRDTHTRSGTIKGKFAYMSPEQCLAKPIDHRTDIFALGVICHELLTARRLFKRSNTYETYEAIIEGKVPRPSQVNPSLDRDLDDLVMKALSYDKEHRYESAEAFGQALLKALHGRGISVSASDVASYYEKYFERELDEHARRMRQLITGQRRRATDDTMNWDAADVIDEASEEEPSGEGSVQELDTQDLEEVGDGDARDADPMATRIELNPLEKAQIAHAGGDAPRRPTPSEKRPTSPERPASVPPAASDEDPGDATIDRAAAAGRTIAPGGIAPVSVAASPEKAGPKRTLFGVSPFKSAPEGATAPPPAAGSSPGHERPSSSPGEPGGDGEAARPASAAPDEAAKPPSAGPNARTLYAGPAPDPASGSSPKVPVPPDTLPPVGGAAPGSAPGGPERAPGPDHGPPPGATPRPGGAPARPPGPGAPHARPMPIRVQTVTTRPGPPLWLLAVLFAVSLGVGLGLTLLIGG